MTHARNHDDTVPSRDGKRLEVLEDLLHRAPLDLMDLERLLDHLEAHKGTRK